MNSKINIENGPMDSHKIIIGRSIFSEFDLENHISLDRKIFVIYDSKINKNSLNQIQSAFNVNNSSLIKIESENAKSFLTYQSIASSLIDKGIDRGSLLISIGGGSIGDLVGFISSTILRGVDHVIIPTTLLAMIDSSIGGKTGIDLGEGKNLIGTFYNPKLVLSDLLFIDYILKDSIPDGFFEMIKYGLIKEPSMLKYDYNGFSLFEDSDLLLDAITNCVRIKSLIVSQDPNDNEIRKILNFGHTIGHAIENIYNYSHGKSVGYGMISASWISNKIGSLSNDEFSTIYDLLSPLLSLKQKFDKTKILDKIKKDKKYVNGVLDFILLDNIGSSYISNEVGDDIIMESIEVL